MPASRWGGVRINSAQMLNPDSRVLLTEEKDDFGLNRLAVDWRLTELDYRTMRTAAETLGAHVAERNIGRVRISDWLLEDKPTPPGSAKTTSPATIICARRG
jgi:hypothetical protein